MLQKRSGQLISTGVGASALVGSACWLLLLMQSTADQAAYSSVKAGPLVLHVIDRTSTANGTAVHISFEKGLLAYIGIWLLVGCLFGVLLTLVSRRGQDSKHL